MSLDDDASSASTLTLLDDYAFKSDLPTMMSEAGPETNAQLKRRAKAVILNMEHSLTTVHEVKIVKILDAMMEGAEKAGLSSGLRYAAAAIIVAFKKGEESNTSATELTRLAQDWLLFFIWPFTRAYRATHSPQSEIFTPYLSNSEITAKTVAVTSRGSRFRNSINQRDGGKCVVTGNLHYEEGLHSGEEAGILEAAYILRKSIIQTRSGCNRIAGTIDIIKHYTKLPLGIIDDLTGIIDDPQNGMLLQTEMHSFFDRYSWCLHPTNVVHKYKVHWFGYGSPSKKNVTEVQFQDHSGTGIPLPNPTFIALHAAVAHILHLSGAAKVIDKIYDTFFDEEIGTARKISVSDYR
ncbi:hypothetical protein BDR04DRAFT_1138076 [Suillus decipiens]|nr:hypothetical protein BDR04DRAFT_1138076 [Suillus decipiens]